ncbi:hypothetical protein M9H77_35876 [Catharanthus roseus]|uniref:Uncharacterized protein n=1 Tax=Catharanthus roseus TaxID=4058 RepID=A0ACB9ZST5_CATRO|nr:hypothetical protein M9H77_35876 [Catharanthus roseus]
MAKDGSNRKTRNGLFRDGDYSGNAYEGSQRRDGHFPVGVLMGIGNFFSRTKIFYYIPYDDCCENSPYGVHKGNHGSHDYSDQSCVKHKSYPSCPNTLEFQRKVIFAYYCLLGSAAFQTFCFLALFLEFGNNGSFYFYLPPKDASECTFLKECKGFNDFENLVTTSSSFECEVIAL